MKTCRPRIAKEINEMSARMIGRNKECKELKRTMEEGTAQLVIVIGRHKVGKTYLIDTFFQKNYAFYMIGVQNFTKEETLSAFAMQLSKYSGRPCPKLENWFDAFWGLADYLDTCSMDEKLVVFFDEMPWMAEPASDFMKALELFWGIYAEKHDNLVFIACGSVTSWMTEKVFHNRGGMFRRCTCRLDVKPLRLGEVEELLQSRGIYLPRQEIARGYMILGGIPEYWKHLDKEMSLSQNIDKLFFSEGGVMRDEVLELYGVVSSRSDDYLSVVGQLSQKRSGLTQEELAKKVKLTGTDDLARILKDLRLCGLVREAFVFGRGINKPVYQLADFYTAFYFHFVHGKVFARNFWGRSIHLPGREAWEGLAFEQLCLAHEELIERVLGIDMLAYPSTWSTKGDASKEMHDAEVDLVLDREDNTINLCEIKFWNDVHTISKDMEDTLRRKMEAFREATGTKKALQVVMITPYGVNTGVNSIVSRQVTLDDLFER